MIGSKVKVIIDRPLGTYHPKHRDIFYTVNYGYVEGIIAPDGEEQDAYVLGIDKPLEEFTGVVLAVIHRLNDVEDKWIVVPEETSFTKEEIIKQVDFQEKYFEIEIRT
jgi:inorganic pyrophosphatase